MSELKNIQIKELVEAGIISSKAINQYIHDQKLALSSKTEVSAQALLSLLRSAGMNPARWIVKKDGRTRLRMHTNLLTAYCKICLYLMEECDFLSDLSDSEQSDIRKELSALCDSSNDFLKATEIISSGQDKAEAYIESIFAKLQKTGYLYQASQVFRTLIAVFLIDPDLMSVKMPQMVDILVMAESKIWCKQTIRPYIVTLLDFYTGELGKQIDRMVDFENQKEKDLLETAIKALCVELYLYEEKDNIRYEKKRAMLYRYASYNSPGKSDILLRKAYSCLIGGLTSHRTEYSWDKISSVSEVALLLSKEEQTSETLLRYEGSKAKILIENGDISILPLGADKKKLQKAIGTDMLPWHSLQIFVDGAIAKRPAITVSDIPVYRTWWSEVERSLFDAKKTIVPQKSKRKPYPEELVDIVIDGVNSYQEGKFNCHVISDKIECQGTISLSDIVSFKIRQEDYPMILQKGFADQRSGFLFKFPAEAHIDERSGKYIFKMKKLIERFVLDEADYLEQETDAVVTGYLPKTNEYTCVSAEGVTILVPKQETVLVPGQYISVYVVDSTTDRKVGLQFIGEYSGEGQRIVTQQDGLVYLLNEYSKGNIYDEWLEKQKELESQPKDPYTVIDNSIIIELMQLLDCEAMAQSEVHKRYNYLEIGKILARVLDDQSQIDYYDNRLKLQMLLQDFSKNETINNAMLAPLEALDSKTKSKFPMLQLRIDELHALDCLGKPNMNQVLYEMQAKATNKELKNLLTLSVAYNNLNALGMHEECKKVSDQINALLCIKYDIKPAIFYGEETEVTEFKTSLVFFANEEHKVIASPQDQMKVILKEICAFLNTKGGKLFIGVNDQGYVSGIEDDLTWFKDHKVFKVSSLDEYQRYLSNSILRVWKGINPLLSIMVEKENNRTVIVVTVQPSRQPLALDDVYFNRVGTTCRVITKESLPSFLQRRPLQYDQMMGITK